MMMKFFAQIILSTVLLQMFPVDAADVQRLATSSLKFGSSPSSYNAFSLPVSHLPIAQAAQPGPVKIKPISLGVVTSAVSAIVIDRKTKRILFQKNIDASRSIGSITKLMTAYVFLETNPDLNALAKLESKDFRAGGVQHIAFGETVTVKDLLYASLISSDNSATASLMRLSGMSEVDFIAKMNETAEHIGMYHTLFVDSTGLSPKNESVVEDIAKLLDITSQNSIITEATSNATYSVTSESGKTYSLSSTDELLDSFINQNPYHVVVAKTGFLPEAGYCLGLLFSNANSGDIMVVVLGAETNNDRFQDVKSLVVWTYETFKW